MGVYFKMIEIHKRADNLPMIEDLFKVMIKKFKHSSKVWIAYMKFMMEKNKAETSGDEAAAAARSNEIKQIMTRALQCLSKPKHIKVISQYAILEFRDGDPEKGRTTFEAILTNYPKRTDIWSIYLDMEIKNGNQETIRNLFERCITLNLKAKKMKFFFKRYLQYEFAHGTPETVDEVKRKAEEWVNSSLNVKEQIFYIRVIFKQNTCVYGCEIAIVCFLFNLYGFVLFMKVLSAFLSHLNCHLILKQSLQHWRRSLKK
eukprot:TRINITY_DN1486_c0_g2_i17.p1 TRINITY_DN1486_c0_g2~~TRINITY_DN1486_c0_g2_i17.p1  ORF type:complete len:259 (+),score=60.38 TRINITY_DN1486_c0_g2_i17:2-778(+)